MDASKKNGLAGKHPSYSGMSAASIKKKKVYDTAYQKTTERKKYRAGLNKANRDAGSYGNGDHKDVSHKKGGGTTMESQSANRARNGQGGKSTKK